MGGDATRPPTDTATMSSCTPSAYRIGAVSVDERLLARLRSHAFGARVHSVFRRVVNVEATGTRALYTIASAGIDNAPATLVADAPSFERFELAPGTRACCDGTTLRLGSALEISLQYVELWSSELPEWPPHEMPVEWLRALIERAGRSGGVKRDARAVLPYDVGLSRRISDTTASLNSALLAGDGRAAYQHGSQLVGLGPGLTPAGDDFLVGLVTICSQPGSPVAYLRPLLTRLVEETVDRTNDISHAAMAHAVEGRVRESISELVKAMVRGDRVAMERRGAQVMRIGATSGTDILSGMLAGLELAEAKRS